MQIHVQTNAATDNLAQLMIWYIYIYIKVKKYPNMYVSKYKFIQFQPLDIFIGKPFASLNRI